MSVRIGAHLTGCCYGHGLLIMCRDGPATSHIQSHTRVGVTTTVVLYSWSEKLTDFAAHVYHVRRRGMYTVVYVTEVEKMRCNTYRFTHSSGSVDFLRSSRSEF